MRRHFQGNSSSKGSTADNARATWIDDARHPRGIAAQCLVPQWINPPRDDEIGESLSLSGK